MNEPVQVSEKPRKISVYTKGQVCRLLQDFNQEISTVKTVKEVREKLAELTRRYTPQSRGRRSGAVNFAALQETVNRARERVTGNDPSTLACMVASLWNMEGENYTKCPINTQRVRSYVEKNKIVFPDGVVFTPRQKRNKATTV